MGGRLGSMARSGGPLCTTEVASPHTPDLPSWLIDIPEHILEFILSFVDVPTLVQARLVSRALLMAGSSEHGWMMHLLSELSAARSSSLEMIPLLCPGPHFTPAEWLAVAAQLGPARAKPHRELHGAAVRLGHCEWRNVAPLRVSARYGHSTIRYGSQLVVFGGRDNNRHMNDVLRLDLRTLSWSVVEMRGLLSPRPKRCHTAALVGSHMYILGGGFGFQEEFEVRHSEQHSEQRAAQRAAQQAAQRAAQSVSDWLPTVTETVVAACKSLCGRRSSMFVT